MTYISAADGTQIYTKIWGEGRPVILMHGWPLSADSWDDQAMAIADQGFKVIAYDRRGFGRSDQPWTGYEYDTLSDDLADVMKATKSRDATISGFSMGGGEVARYMSRHDGKGVSQTILISSIVPFMLKTSNNPNGVDQETFGEMADSMKKDRTAFFESFFKDFYGVGLVTSPVSQGIVDWSIRTAMQAGLKSTLDCATAFATTDFRKELSAFTVPTLIIHGTADKTVPIDTSARPAHKAIKNSKLIEVDGAAHGLLATHKNEMTKMMLNFLKK